jgi:hypothetical protein
MSSFVINACCALTVVAACACGPRSLGEANHPSAEARNGETEKKARKRRPVVAPPPAYGNKIVLDDDTRQDVSENHSSRLEPTRF